MLRFCSTLGTVLLALAVASPAFADNKKKKKKSDESAQETPAPSEDKSGGGEDLDSLMQKSKDKPDKRGAAGGGSGEASGGGEAKSDTPIGDSWERPPMEEEKPHGPAPKAEEKPAGDGRPWAAGLILGWGFKTDRTFAQLGADPYLLDIGIRGGYTFDFKLYVGLFYEYFIGSSETGTSARVVSTSQTTHANYMVFGPEVGYDIWAGPVIIRPSLELGPALAFTNVSGKTTSLVRMAFGPGIDVIYPWPGGFFLGGEARAKLVPSSNGVSAFLLALHGGLRFQ